jgi:REP element-mobilizing transposase RayT
MARQPRIILSKEEGGYHVISRIVGSQFLMGPQEKTDFVTLLRYWSTVYFVDLHAFCIMDNHFHLLLTMDIEAGMSCSSEVLQSRWDMICKGIPQKGPSHKYKGLKKYDRNLLRERLCSLSRFVQDLKQSFSRYYNAKYKRSGYLWGARFKSIVLSTGKAFDACNAYIHYNPVRAGMVSDPFDYPWSSAFVNSNSDVDKQMRGKYSYHISTCQTLLRKIASNEEKELGRFVKERVPNLSSGYVFGSRQFSITVYAKLNRMIKKLKTHPVLSGIYVLRVLRN